MEAILEELEARDIQVSTFIVNLLTSPRFQTNPAAANLVDNVEHILHCFLHHIETRSTVENWSEGIARKLYASELTELTKERSGLHFNARNATAEQLQPFKIEVIAEKMKDTAPRLCSLVAGLLDADEELSRRRERRWQDNEVLAEDVADDTMDNPEPHDSAELDDSLPREKVDSARRRRNVLLRIVRSNLFVSDHWELAKSNYV